MRIRDWSSDVCSSDLQYLLASVVVHHCWFWFPESQHFGDRGATLSPHGSAPRPGIYDLLHGHQFRRGAWRDHRGLSGSDLGLVLGFRRGGVWHADRKRVVSGKSVSVRVDLGGRRLIKKKIKKKTRKRS